MSRSCFQIAEMSQCRLVRNDIICLDIYIPFIPSSSATQPNPFEMEEIFLRALLRSLPPFTLPVAAAAASHFAARHLSRMYNSRFLQ